MDNSGSDSSAVLTTENVESFIRSMMTALVHSTKTSHSVPSGSDYEYFANFEEFRQGMGGLSSELVEQIQQICQVVGSGSGSGSGIADTVAPPPDLADAALYDQVVDMIDVLLESADQKMDQMAGGGSKVTSSIRNSLSVDQENIFSSENSKVLEKPQLKFYDEINNMRRQPFRPRLSDKVHSVAPLDVSALAVERDQDDDLTVVGPNTYYPHPYTREILAVCSRSQYQSQIAEAAFVSPELPSAGQPFELVQSLEALQRMADELDGVKEVAVDLEHHHVRTYLGLTCLMQLSCRDKDYIVDVIALRRHMSVLLPIFDDPDIVKVFHGCEKDILWLQRDLGLYVVNCFDTYQAAKALRFPALSLAHLLKHYCGVTLNKKYQLADWRERPLPAHLIEYAKLDTHYLLYVYDCLRRDVHSSHGTSGIETVHEASRRTCLQRYEKDLFYPLGYLKLVSQKSSRETQPSRDLTFEQNAVLSCLWNWRDLTARDKDESCGYIMSNAELLRIGMAVPHDAQDIIATGPLSVYVREHLEDIVDVIRKQVHEDSESKDNIIMRSDIGGSNVMEQENFTLNLSPTRISKKRSSFDIGMGGSRHQVGRMLGYSTVTEFTPCLPTVPVVSSFQAGSRQGRGDAENVHRNFQMLMDTDPDWKKKLFEEANWRQNPSPVTRIKVEAPVEAAALGYSKVPARTGNMAARVEKSESDLKKFSLVHENSKFSSSSEVSSEKQETSKKLTSPNVVPDDVALDVLPQSLSDIYNISNRNKWRNKDKKRNRDSTEVVSSTALDVAESSQRGDWYHVEKDKNTQMVDNVEGSLDLAAQVGWIGGDVVSRNEMRKNHASNESNNMSAAGNQQDQSVMSGTDSVSSSFDSKKSSKSSKQSFNKDKGGNKDSNYGYDYTRMSNANSAMGAMSTVNTAASGGDGGKYNPFLSGSSSGGGNGGYSNASNRSNNNNASKSRKQSTGSGKSNHNPAVIVRRDTNRSHIFSAPTNK